MPFTIKELFEAFEYQQKQIDKLRQDYEKLKAWSDLNDQYMRELVDTLSENMDKILQVVELPPELEEDLPKVIAAIREIEAAEAEPANISEL